MKTTKHIFLATAMCLCIAFGAKAAYNGTPVTPSKITSANYASYGFTAETYLAYENWYAISTAEELYGFATLVNNSNSEKDVFNCVLTADIVVNEHVLTAAGGLNGTPTHSWTPIGKPNTRQAFAGKFDGQGHTISGLYYNGSNSSIGLFGGIEFIYDENGSRMLSKISNVGVIDSYFKGSSWVGGICSSCKQSIISNCYNTGVVIGSSYVGGISGTGSTGTDRQDFGFIVNCYNTGIVEGSQNVGGICGASPFTYNTYYLAGCAKDGRGKVQNGIGNSKAGQTTDDISGSIMSATAEEFASGKIAYMLNGKVSGGATWYQNLNSNADPSPVFENSHGVVYASQPCPMNFANCEVETEEHDLIDGICSKCGGYETPSLVDGWYLIDNASKLYWFADAVNSGNNTICGKLTADIVVNENVLKADGSLNGTPTHYWTPIGTYTNGFAGKFDGQGHTISGLYFDHGHTIECISVGLFGYAFGIREESPAEIANVGIIDSFIGGSGIAGGICGYCSFTTITNCYNTGTVMDGGGICGGCYSKITNCYNTGKVGGKNAICGYGSAIINNCYYLDGCVGITSSSGSNGRKATAEEFASGKIAYLLNGSVSEGDLVWYQTLFSDAAPVLDPTHNRVTGYVDEADNVITVYGDLMIASDYEITEGKTLVVPEGASVTIAEGVELINNGAITINGILIANGTVSGNEIGGSGNFTYTNLSDSDIKFASDGYTYKGTEYTLENGLSDIVKERTICGKQFSFDATGYTISYENNINVGDNAKIIWTGNSTVEKTFAITPITLSASVKADDKVYDGTTDATGTVTLIGVVEGDDVTVNFTASFIQKICIEKIIVEFNNISISGLDAGNYVLPITRAIGEANIYPKRIPVSATANDKEYDGTTTATGTVSLIGVAPNDDVKVSYTAVFADENVNNGTNVYFSNIYISGKDAINYSLDNRTATATANITPNTNVVVTITGNSNTATYNTEEQNISGYTVDIEDATGVYTENDIAFSGTAAASGTAHGTYAMELSADNFSNTNSNFAEVQFVVTDGVLTINKAENAPDMPTAIETYYINTQRVALPDNWQWVENIALEKGENTAAAQYVGTDAGNYENERAEVTITRTACPHNEGYTTINVAEPTCTEEGYTGDHLCNICNEIFEQGESIEALGHTEAVDAAVAATCTAAGKTEGKHCSVCNEVIVAQTEIAALGHDFKNYVYNNDATTTSDGTKTATCERGCGATDTKLAEGTKLPETPTAVSDDAANTVNIYAYGNTIVVENATEEICVYNAMGALVGRTFRDAVSTTGTTAITINTPGIYIVKTGDTVKRVMVND